METAIFGLYLALAIFGLGTIVFVDILGMSGDFGESGEGGGEGGGDSGIEGEGADEGADETYGYESLDRGAAAVAPAGRATPMLRLLLVSLRTLRLLVYFATAGGVMGLTALLSGTTLEQSLAWAGGAGVAGTLVGWLIYRLRYQESNSLLEADDYIGARATVLMSLEGEEISRVRTQIGQFTRDLPARIASRSKKKQFKRGDRVVIDLLKQGVAWVRSEDGDEP